MAGILVSTTAKPKNGHRVTEKAYNSRLGNKLVGGITISCKSISAVVPSDEYKSAFNCYLHL